MKKLTFHITSYVSLESKVSLEQQTLFELEDHFQVDQDHVASAISDMDHLSPINHSETVRDGTFLRSLGSWVAACIPAQFGRP
ncbi:MAG: hypothetical protein ACLPVO_01625 [Desulfomonilaceae bacterium]